MTAVEHARHLCDQARSIRSRAQDTRAQTQVLAEATAATEDQIAATFDQLAREQPRRAEYLRDMGESVRASAASNRSRVIPLPEGRDGRGRDHAPGPAGPPAAITGALTTGRASDLTTGRASDLTTGRASDLAVIEERDRIAAELQDSIIRRVFAAGLSLETAAGLAASQQVRARIDSAISELDQVIREIRNAVFQDARHPASPRLSPDAQHLSGQLATTASVRVTGLVGSARLLLTLRMILGLIGEHAALTSVDVAAGTSSYSLAIEAVPLAPDEQAAEHADWLSTLRARAAQVGVDVVIEPVPGGTRFICELPVGA